MAVPTSTRAPELQRIASNWREMPIRLATTSKPRPRSVILRMGAGSLIHGPMMRSDIMAAVYFRPAQWSSVETLDVCPPFRRVRHLQQVAQNGQTVGKPVFDRDRAMGASGSRRRSDHDKRTRILFADVSVLLNSNRMWLMRSHRQVDCPASAARLNCCGWLGNVEVLGYPIIYLQIKVYCRFRSGPWLSGKLLVFRTCMPALWSPSKGVTVPAQPALVASAGSANQIPR